MFPIGFRPAKNAVKRSFLLSVLLTIGLVSLSACGDTTHSPTQKNAPSKEASNRYNSLPPLDLKPGEAKPGIHIRPGIEVITLDEEASKDVQIDAESMTAKVTGRAKEILEEQDEIWSGDVFMGEGFMFRIVDIKEIDGEIILEIAEFGIMDVLHGEWDIKLEPIDEEAQEGVRQQGIDLPSVGVEGTPVRAGLEIDLLRVKLSAEASISTGLDFSPRGGVKFPTDFKGNFKGRIPLGGTDHDCEAVEKTTMLGKIGEKLGRAPRIVIKAPRYCVDSFLLMGTINVDLDYGYTATSTGAASFDRALSFPIPVPPIPVPPLLIIPDPFVKFGIGLSFGGELSHEMNASAKYPILFGIDYNRRDYGMTTIPNERHPALSATSSISSAGAAKAKGNAKIYTALGIGLEITTIATGPRIKGTEIATELGLEGTITPWQWSSNGNYDPCLKAELYNKGYFTQKVSFGINAFLLAGITLETGPAATVNLNNKSLNLWKSKGTDFCIIDPNEIRELNVTLQWEADTDLDLYLETPNGEVLNYGRRNTTDGGVYLGDSCIDGDCDGQNEERIEWEHQAPPKGEYKVWVVNFDGEAAADYTIVVKNEHGVLQTITGSIAAVEELESNIHTFSIGVQN